jgi:hypothetical protein
MVHYRARLYRDSRSPFHGRTAMRTAKCLFQQIRVDAANRAVVTFCVRGAPEPG